MLTLNLALPPLRRLVADAAIAQGALARWCARGDRLPDAPAGRSVWTRELFQFAGTSVPVAALTRDIDAADATGFAWLRADPAHVRADMSTARMLACGDMGLTPAECQELLQPLKPLFGDSGFPIDSPVPSRWYLRAPAGAMLPTFATPDDVLGDDLKRHLPDGAQGRRWRSLLSEAQIILHNHPVNAARAERGAMPVNSLWFWGAGTLPEWVKSSLTRALSNDPSVIALANRAKVAHGTPGSLESSLSDLSRTERALLDLDDASGLADLNSRWLPAIDQLLAKRKLAELRLLFASGERYAIRPSQRWRFWRRVVPLSA
ncbi:MAG: phosphoglycerate mutase [Tahibacter sp.]